VQGTGSSPQSSLPTDGTASKVWNWEVQPPTLSIEEHALTLLAGKKEPIDHAVEKYFRTYHQSLPIINQDELYHKLQLQAKPAVPEACFSALLAGMFLVTRLGAGEGTMDGVGRKEGEEFYPRLKRVLCLLQGAGSVNLDLVRLGLLVASWEHWQGLHQEAWLTVGTCARLGQVLGLHLSLKEWDMGSGVDYGEWEARRVLWYGVIVLER
jgi:hypothetical protein